MIARIVVGEAMTADLIGGAAGIAVSGVLLGSFCVLVGQVEPPSVEAGRTLLENFYFNPKRYDLAKVGRYKINKKLGLTADLTESVLRIDDITTALRYLLALHSGVKSIEGVRNGEVTQIPVEYDDIDHLGNRRIRAVGELIG